MRQEAFVLFAVDAIIAVGDKVHVRCETGVVFLDEPDQHIDHPGSFSLAHQGHKLFVHHKAVLCFPKAIIVKKRQTHSVFFNRPCRDIMPGDDTGS